MEITEHNNDDTISIELAVKSKRLRNSVKSSLSNDIDVEKNVTSSSSVSDNSDSEEEWNFAKTKTIKKVPKQTLKTKLAEKTKYLRKISKLTSFSEEKCSTHRVPKSSEDEVKLGILKIKPNSELCEIKNFEEKNENNDLAEDVKKVDEIHHYATRKDDSESAKISKIKNEEIERDVIVKEECIKGNLSEDKKTSNQEPIVLICAINRPTPTSEVDVSTPQASPARHGIVSPQHSSQGILVSSHISPSLVTNSSGQILSPGVSQNSTFNTDVQRNQSAIVEFSNSHKNLSSSNSNLTTNNNFLPRHNTILEQRYSLVQSSPGKNGLSYSSRRNALGNSVFQSTPTSPALQRTPNRTYNAILRTPSPAQQTAHRNLRISHSGNSLGKTKQIFSPNQAGRSPNLKNHRSNPSSPLVRKTSASVNKNNRNSMLNKFNNISPSGTVIHTGTGSVTITPRKVIPERPPVQRKLFKNEIEGTISCHSAQGTLQYVVNLANGTHIPLSNMQVQKLREQHNGALPIKLKIPVPCDVADKIEPSFLIED